jgi:hypothetical protein
LPNHADCAQIEQPSLFPKQPVLKSSGQRAMREHSHPLSKGGKIPFPAEPRQNRFQKFIKNSDELGK